MTIRAGFDIDRIAGEYKSAALTVSSCPLRSLKNGANMRDVEFGEWALLRASRYLTVI